jgi:hypothetical protein
MEMYQVVKASMAIEKKIMKFQHQLIAMIIMKLKNQQRRRCQRYSLAMKITAVVTIIAKWWLTSTTPYRESNVHAITDSHSTKRMGDGVTVCHEINLNLLPHILEERA